MKGAILKRSIVLVPLLLISVSSRAQTTLLPGQQIWAAGVSSFLFGSNDTEEWADDNIQTDPLKIIQPSMKQANLTLLRTFVFHYSLRDGHRTSIGTAPQIQLNPNNPHEYDQPAPPANSTTGTGFEVELRIKTAETMGMVPLVVLRDIATDAANNVDPNPDHKRIIDPDTQLPETDLDFARKVVAYLGNRVNLYEIGNESDLDEYTGSGMRIQHMDIRTYVDRWTEFVRELRKINPNAKFIGPATYNAQGNDCWYGPQNGPPPFPATQPGDCYLRNFLHGVKGTDVEPDAVSFHWYPCNGATLTNCDSAATQSYGTVTTEVKNWVMNDLGHAVPVGITEWNFDPGSNPLGENGSFMYNFTTGALAAMIAAKLDFANQFDVQSSSGFGHLDMFDVNNGDQPKPQFFAIRDMINKYIVKPKSKITDFALEQNFPNPFNLSTTIRYALPFKSVVRLTVHTTLGQLVAVLAQGEQEAGYYDVKFDGSSRSSGMYFYTLQAGAFVKTNRLLLLR